VPGAVDDKITKRIVDALEKTMKDVNENPGAPDPAALRHRHRRVHRQAAGVARSHPEG
jgi:hypothetical protein